MGGPAGPAGGAHARRPPPTRHRTPPPLPSLAAQGWRASQWKLSDAQKRQLARFVVSKVTMDPAQFRALAKASAARAAAARPPPAVAPPLHRPMGSGHERAPPSRFLPTSTAAWRWPELCSATHTLLLLRTVLPQPERPCNLLGVINNLQVGRGALQGHARKAPTARQMLRGKGLHRQRTAVHRRPRARAALGPAPHYSSGALPPSAGSAAPESGWTPLRPLDGTPTSRRPRLLPRPLRRRPSSP